MFELKNLDVFISLLYLMGLMISMSDTVLSTVSIFEISSFCYLSNSSSFESFFFRNFLV